MTPVIEIQNIGKLYRLSHARRPDTLKALLRGLVQLDRRDGEDPTDEDFWALRHINLTLEAGQCLALLGKNGSGKSTLLKVLSRIIPPSEGRIRVRGRVASLLEVGTGFHPELTGRENIILNGTILGCTRAEVRQRFDAIVAFSGVERFLDTPVKHYSSGMYVRLAYAIAAHANADILVIDEVLAVGDADFQGKCFAHLGSLFAQGRSAIVVSHDTTKIRKVASHCAWIDAGRLVAAGGVQSDILARYEASMSPAAGAAGASSGAHARTAKS